MARAQNPALLSGRQHVTATRASEVTAGLRQNPNFTLSGAEVSLPADNPGQPIHLYRERLATLRAGAEESAGGWTWHTPPLTLLKANIDDTERQTILQVKQAFTNMLTAKAALKIAGDNLDSYSKTVDLSKARLNAGDISATDFDRIDLQLAEFEADNNAAKLDLIQASDQLQLLLGIATPTKTFDITGTLDPPVLTQTMEQVEQSALAARPDYQAAVQSVRVADASVHLADAEGTTDPTLGGEYERSGTYNSAGFQISIPLRVFDRNQGEKERTRYEAQASRFAETAARNQVINDVDQAWAAYEAAIEMAKRYNSHYVAESQRVRENLEYSYRHGGATLLDYLDALRDYRQINLDALTANQQVWLSVHQLSFAAATKMLP